MSQNVPKRNLSSSFGLALIAACAIACSSKPKPAPSPPPPAPPPVAVVLASPGPLAAGHAAIDVEGGCNECHVTGSKEISNDKCLACHEHGDLKARMAAGKGFHASAVVRGKPCSACHLDHRGRSYDHRGWTAVKGGEAGFDHALSGWPLNGKHATTACDKCHTRHDAQGLAVYMGTDRLCGGCHRDAQPHKLARRELFACERCHSEGAWKPPLAAMKFDHDDRRDAAMPLLGAHRNVACAKCHTQNVFVSAKRADPGACDDCHKAPHTGQRFTGRPCAQCHTPTLPFAQSMFDHRERTGVDLVAHRKLGCDSCHARGRPERPAIACAACHAGSQPPGRTVSRHKNRFKQFGQPPACQTCHPPSSWRPTAFDHTKHTKLPLSFRHASTGCRACHRGNGPADFEDFKGVTSCTGCHAHAKVHDNKYTDAQCVNCHINPGPPPRPPSPIVTQIHGPPGTFPLVKGHKNVPCADCHTARTAAGKTKFDGLTRECVACHLDTHQGRRGKICTTCHRPGTWDIVVNPMP